MSGGGFPRAVRIRTGVARFADGWNVVAAWSYRKAAK